MPAKFEAQIFEAAEILKIPNSGDLGVLESKLKSRMAGMRLGETCGRCHGSGHFSRNSLGSTVCYRCSGACVTYPTTPKGWSLVLVAARTSVESGELESYLKFLQGRKVSKTALGTVMKAWEALGLKYNWMEAVEAKRILESSGSLTPEQSRNLDLSNFNSRASEMYSEIQLLVFGSDGSKKDPRSEEERHRCLPSALEEALKGFEALRKEVESYKAGR